jgi:hypothetical protein
MKSSILSLLSLAALTIAAPPPPPGAPGEGAYPWTPTLAGYYEQVAQHIQEARGRPGGPGAPSCDLSQATMPTAPTPLPSPDGLRLAHVALGRGVQVSIIFHLPLNSKLTSFRIIPAQPLVPKQHPQPSAQSHVSTTPPA